MTTVEASFKLYVAAAVGPADPATLLEDMRDLLIAVGEAAQESGPRFRADPGRDPKFEPQRL